MDSRRTFIKKTTAIGAGAGLFAGLTSTAFATTNPNEHDWREARKEEKIFLTQADAQNWAAAKQALVTADPTGASLWGSLPAGTVETIVTTGSLPEKYTSFGTSSYSKVVDTDTGPQTVYIACAMATKYFKVN